MTLTVDKSIQRQRNIKVFFFILLHCAILLIILFTPYLLLSSILGVVTFYLLNPIVIFLENHGFKRNFAALIPFIGLSLFFYFVSNELFPVLINQLGDLQKLTPTYFNSFKKLIEQLEQSSNPFVSLIRQSNLIEQIQDYLLRKASLMMDKLPSLFSASLTTLFLTPFLGYFLLSDGKNFYQNFLKFVPNHLFEVTVQVNYEINAQMGQFIRARLLESTIVGAILLFGLTWIKSSLWQYDQNIHSEHCDIFIY